jgi:hypothetical protein
MIRVYRERTHHDEGAVVLNVQLNRSRNQYARELDMRKWYTMMRELLCGS